MVRALIIDAAEEPMAVADAGERLASSPYTLDDLVDIGLVAIREARVSPALTFLSARDQRRLAARARVHARALADLILADRPAIERAAQPLIRASDEPRAVLFAVVGCMALDWDGLAFTALRGYRTDATVRGAGFAYTPWMKENAADVSRRGLYWGAHSAPAGPFTFTSFGDHHSLPRRSLPDLAFGVSPRFALDDLARTLVALRTGDVAPQVDERLAYLLEIGFAREKTGRINAAIPMFDHDDAAAVGTVVSRVRDRVRVWHDTHYRQLQVELSDLTPLRHGVPYAAVYTEIWHYVFGYTNLYLSQAGMITDPYAPGSSFNGFVPFLWETSVYPARR